MGQVRAHLTNDVAGLAEWMFRKVRNHDPMSQRDAQEVRRAKKFALNERGAPKTRRGHERVIHEENTNVVTYHLGNGKNFRMTVEEIDDAGNVIPQEGIKQIA